MEPLRARFLSHGASSLKNIAGLPATKATMPASPRKADAVNLCSLSQQVQVYKSSISCGVLLSILP